MWPFPSRITLSPCQHKKFRRRLTLSLNQVACQMQSATCTDAIYLSCLSFLRSSQRIVVQRRQPLPVRDRQQTKQCFPSRNGKGLGLASSFSPFWCCPHMFYPLSQQLLLTKSQLKRDQRTWRHANLCYEVFVRNYEFPKRPCQSISLPFHFTPSFLPSFEVQAVKTNYHLLKQISSSIDSSARSLGNLLP